MDNLGEDVTPGTLVYVTKSNEVQFQSNAASQLGPSNAIFVAAAMGVQLQGVAYVSNLAGSNSGFSGTQGANNWSYGYFPSGNVNSFTPLPTYNASAQRWQHTSFGPPWTLVGADSQFHPNGANNGMEEWATRRWVSPVSGMVTISGHLAKNDTSRASTGVFGRVYLNHNLIYQQFIAGTDGVGVDYSVAANLNAGDLVDFAVAPNGVDTSDATMFSSTISTTVPVLTGSGGPTITAVSNAAGGQGGVAPRTFLSIYGSNFAPAGFFDDWGKSVIGGKLPVSLDGVSVSIGGQPAYIEVVTPNQINILTPDLGTESAALTITTGAGTSPPFYTASDPVQPALFPWPGSQAVATHLDFSYAAKNGTLPVITIPAKPGETIILWGTGFGATIPAAPDGQVVPTGNYMLSGVSVTVGGQPVTVLGGALASGLAGVYQIAIQLPANLPNGDYPVIAAILGAQSPPQVFLTVQQ